MSPKPYSKAKPPTAELHRRWLQLVEVDGPFLSVPVLKRVYPQGISTVDNSVLAELKPAKDRFEQIWDQWSKGQANLDEYRVARDEWVETVLRRVLGWGEHYTTDTTPTTVTSPNGKVSVTSTGAFSYNGETSALTWVIDPARRLGDLSEDGWATNAIDRMELLLRAAEVPIGLVTDGRWWALVSAQPKTTAASGIFDTQTWIEEPATRDAFVALLSPIRLAGGKQTDRLPQLFKDSVTAAEDITEALGSQVRQAVELLVQSFSESAEDATRRGDPNPLPDNGDEIYSAAVTVMMRVVFLLFAEERDLLPQGELFDAGYGLSGQLEMLRRRAEDETHEALETTSTVWHRLLATSRALYRGASFEDMRLPAYGGSLFSPDRFAFLSGLTDRGTLALSVNDRVMMHVLDAVQMAEVKGEGRRPISFRDIDVEQIGYIYEGLLGYTCRFASEVVVGLVGKKGTEPEIPLRLLNDFADTCDSDKAIADAIIKWAKDNQPSAAPLPPSALAKAIAASDAVEDAEVAIRSITHDAELAGELKSWLGAIRRDLRDRPTVFKQGGLLVVETPSRKNAGAHYTPRSLAEEVVLHALEPLVYSPGPYQTPNRDEWQLKAPEEILDLKVADIACGSGAFLVAAARYLGARLVEAWAETGTGIGTAQQQETDAVRKVVAQCLYGADINEMAIEMCKLSLWLVSLDPKLPFSFVDDKLLVGNSLLGITDLAQLEALHIDPKKAPEQPLFDVTSAGFGSAVDVRGAIDKAIRIRKTLASEVNDNDPQRSSAAKQGQLQRLHDVTAQLRDVADGVIAVGLRLGGKSGKALDAAYENLRIAVNDAYPSYGAPDRALLESIQKEGLTPTVETDYDRWQPLHWAIELPDVFEHGGFDAVIGNPPFLGGQKITGAMGTNMRDWYVNALASGARGSADLVAYFFLRSAALLKGSGTLGLIATNTVAQGDTRKVGLDRLAANGFTIMRSIQSRSWPAASANLEYAAAWGTLGRVAPGTTRVADDVAVPRISTLLEAEGRVSGAPLRLVENSGIAFQGCIVLGMGFVLEPEAARTWIEADPRNAEVMFPYLNGEDLNSRPDCSAARWVIDFKDQSQEWASHYALPFSQVLEHVKKERMVKPKAVSSSPWWQFLRPRPALRKAIAGLDEVLVIALVSKTVMPVRVPTGQVFSHRLGVFATESFAEEALLSSSPHWLWAVTYSSTLETRVNYSPSDVFVTDHAGADRAA
jgi:type I restriction-modification system DNA methylase subunit